MCGIIGYIGEKNSIPILLEGLKKLEYRGYDSSGLAYLDSSNDIYLKKAEGKLERLEAIVDLSEYSNIGIAHTRWATHGRPSEKNAHPHLSNKRKIAVIHNGIVENYQQIKKWLLDEGYRFESETDSEVIAHLIEYYLEQDNDLLDAIKLAVDVMHGAYAIGVISTNDPERIIAVRKDSPLVIGLGEKENFIASDVPAILKHTRKVKYIENDEFVEVRKDKVTVYDEFLKEIKRDYHLIDWSIENAEKSGYEHFTLKEIHEQPIALTNVIKARITKENDINIEIDEKLLKDINKIIIVACGTAYYAGLIGKYYLEKYLNIKVDVEIASEFRYQKTFVDSKTLTIAVSQSGETLDTLHAVRKAKSQGAKVLSVLNVMGSSIARESDYVVYTNAGPEIGVASTKAYTTQIVILYLIALKLAKGISKIGDEVYKENIEHLIELPKHIENALKIEDYIKRLAHNESVNERIFFIGRQRDYYSSLEASLKLKELSYINSFAIQAGELKHGTIALVEDGSLVVAFNTDNNLYDKTLSNINEVKSRGAKVLSLTRANDDVSDMNIKLDDVGDDLVAITSIIPMQLFAYYMSLARGNDVDTPRNLAKSVTVE